MTHFVNKDEKVLQSNASVTTTHLEKKIRHTERKV